MQLTALSSTSFGRLTAEDIRRMQADGLIDEDDNFELMEVRGGDLLLAIEIAGSKLAQDRGPKARGPGIITRSLRPFPATRPSSR